MSKVTFDYSKAAPFIGDNEVESMKKLALDAKELLVSKKGAGNFPQGGRNFVPLMNWAQF